MAEYWKSAPRFWCKQCKIFIRDTPFEKTQHEASPKHQASLRRFLRDIHKNNEIQQRESQRAKSEVERLRQAVGGGSPASNKPDGNAAAPAKRTAVPAPKLAERPVSIEERKKQMSQLAEMGIAVPEEYRADMALAGDWQTVSETKIEDEGLEGAAKSIGVCKRKHEGDEEDEEHAPEPLERQGWGSRMKTYPGAQGDDDEDLDALLASTKDLKKPKKADTATATVSEESEEQKPGFAPVLKTEEGASESKVPETDESTSIKKEEAEPSVSLKDEIPPNDEVPGAVFKKRKPKVMRK